MANCHHGNYIQWHQWINAREFKAHTLKSQNISSAIVADQVTSTRCAIVMQSVSHKTNNEKWQAKQRTQQSAFGWGNSFANGLLCARKATLSRQPKVTWCQYESHDVWNSGSEWKKSQVQIQNAKLINQSQQRISKKITSLTYSLSPDPEKENKSTNSKIIKRIS